VFGVVTAALVRAKEAGRAKLGELAQAISENRKLWFVLAEDCAQNDNALPYELRAKIISLAVFVDRHSTEVVRHGADVDVLIDINRSMMEGLVGR
jgi:flagellar protein FlaF